MNSEVEEIKARLNIVELVGSYVKLVKSGAHWKAPCPFHHEKTPSFMVNEERQMWHCFGCNKGGDAFAFLMEIEGIEFREALRILAERTGVELRRGREFASGNEHRSSRSIEVLEWATKFYEKQLWDGAGKSRALPYLTGRGLTEESIRQFRLGYAPQGWRNILEFLTKRGFSGEEIETAGLIIRKSNESQAASYQQAQTNFYDRFRERIMFPIADPLGRVIGFSARVEPGADESQAKYINTPETDVYHKSRALYGIFTAKQAMKQEDVALLVEGNMDVIAAQQAGFTNTVAVSGTALTEDQLKIIRRYTNKLQLFFDMDSAGQTAARRSTELALGQNMEVSIVAIADRKDAAELAQHDPEALRQAVRSALPAPAYFLERLLVRYNRNDPQGRKTIVDEYVGILAAIADPVLRGAWLKRFAETIEVEERMIFPAVERLLKEWNLSSRQGIETSVPTRDPLPNTVSKRSEALRHKVALLALLDFSVWKELSMLASETGVTSATTEKLSETVRTFLFQHPILDILQTMDPKEDAFSRMQDLAPEPTDRERLVAAYFEGERFLAREGLADLSAEERSEKLIDAVRSYLAELTKEINREFLLSLERGMKQAREAGDRVREKELLAEFLRQSQKNS